MWAAERGIEKEIMTGKTKENLKDTQMMYMWDTEMVRKKKDVELARMKVWQRDF